MIARFSDVNSGNAPYPYLYTAAVERHSRINGIPSSVFLSSIEMERLHRIFQDDRMTEHPQDGVQLLYLPFVLVATKLRHDLLKRHLRSKDPFSSHRRRIAAKLLAARTADARCRHRHDATVDARRG